MTQQLLQRLLGIGRLLSAVGNPGGRFPTSFQPQAFDAAPSPIAAFGAPEIPKHAGQVDLQLGSTFG
ncbi:MAG: hypothetical protein K6U87_13900 [Firmicutes bacterium]|nr:hypothetical protein [Bacillota bacterium]